MKSAVQGCHKSYQGDQIYGKHTEGYRITPREGDWAGFRINFPQMRGQRSKLTSPPLLILTLSAKVHYLIVLRGVAAAWPPEELRQVKRGSPLNANGTGVS